jgi:hypothetical protein
MTNEEIQTLVSDMEAESKALRKDLYKMAWFMRGSISIDQAFSMDYDDRAIVSKIIEENLETTKKTGLNFF